MRADQDGEACGPLDWKAGRADQCVLFETARAHASAADKAKHSALLWAGNAAVFMAGNVLGAGSGPSMLHWAAPGPEAGFAVAAAIGAGMSIAVAILRAQVATAHGRQVGLGVEAIEATAEQLAKDWCPQVEGAELSAPTKLVLRRLAASHAARGKGPGDASKP